MLVVAHRLSTSIGFDKVSVLDQGNIAKFDTLEELNSGGPFDKLLYDSGETKDH